MVMGSSNLMTGLTLVLVICLAVVLGLVLVLLAELYCSAVLRRRHTTTTTTVTDQESLTLTTTTTTVDPTTNPPPSLTNLYTQSILSAPRNLLYPTLTTVTVAGATVAGEKPPAPENQENDENLNNLMYISNPVYDGDEVINGRRSRVAGTTPFETPETSPSRLETEETSSGDDGDDGGGEGGEVTSVKVVVVGSPELSPVKKLPETVGDGGGANSDDVGVSSSSSSSGTPCTSLSW